MQSVLSIRPAAALAASIAFCSAASAVQPAGPLTDHMILQRGKPAPVWGTARAGEKVTVRFAGQSISAVADAGGNWMVRLAPLKASAQPRELTLSAPSGTVTIKDVLVGDVWIAGGQSNMARQVGSSWMPSDQEMDYPSIRYLPVASAGSKYPTTALEGQWTVCTDETTPKCTAVGFFFAERVFKETGIPQGLLWNAVGGSVAREWIPQFGWRLRPRAQGHRRRGRQLVPVHAGGPAGVPTGH